MSKIKYTHREKEAWNVQINASVFFSFINTKQMCIYVYHAVAATDIFFYSQNIGAIEQFLA